MKQFRNKKNQIIGELSKKVFRKRVKLSKHLLKMMDAWGIDESVIDSLKDHRCEEIRLLDEEHNIVYSIPFDEFRNRGILKDFGESPQLFVSRDFFTTEQL